MSARFRVILVGRTGLDAHLRLDPEVELVRVAGTLDAVGELADPMEDAPPSSVVIVSEGAEPGDEPERRAFIEALRTLDPQVRVLRASAEPASPNGLYDGAVCARDGAAAVRAALEPETHSFAQRLLHAGDEDQRAQRQADDVMETLLGPPPAPATGDGSLVQRLLEGREVLPAAIELLRARAGLPALRFEHADDTRDEAPATDETRLPVEARGQRFGELVAPARADRADLEPHARWLAHWLRLEDLHAELRTAAFTDALTGAWNRRYFERFLAAAIDESARRRQDLTLLVFDIDNFKSFNDAHGHGMGDRILVEAVRLLRSVIRPTDRVCRIGGDEFAVIFHDPDGPRDPASKHPRDVYAIARRFQQQICNHRFPALGAGLPTTLTISGGLATFPWDGRSAPELLERADALALESKRAGKNAITLGPAAARVCGTGAFDGPTTG